MRPILAVFASVLLLCGLAPSVLAQDKKREEASEVKEADVKRILAQEKQTQAENQTELRKELGLLTDIKEQRDALFRKQQEIKKEQEKLEAYLEDLNARIVKLEALRAELSVLIEKKN